MQNLIHIGRYIFIPESKLSTNINFKFQFRQNHLKPKQSTYYALHFFVLVPRNFTTKNSSRGKQAKKSRNLLVKNVLKNSTIFDSYEFWEFEIVFFYTDILIGKVFLWRFFLEWKNPQFNFSSQNLGIEHNFYKWDGKETKILHLLFHWIWKKQLFTHFEILPKKPIFSLFSSSKFWYVVPRKVIHLDYWKNYSATSLQKISLFILLASAIR